MGQTEQLGNSWETGALRRTTARDGVIVWEPTEDRIQGSRLRRFLDEQGMPSYDEAWRWSVSDIGRGEFWSAVARWFGVNWHSEPSYPCVETPANPTGVHWFPGGTLNYAEACMAPATRMTGRVAVRAYSQTRRTVELTWGDLEDMVARVRTGLITAGVGHGDCVAAYLPNIPEALAAMIATASLGAIWTCCAPEMGVAGALDRLQQARPAAFISVDGYRYGDRLIDRRDESERIRAGLPTLRAAVWLSYANDSCGPPRDWIPWATFVSETVTLDFVAVPFDHPLYVLYSSGTTGKPKAIVHGHGGILLEHAKALGLHFDLGEGHTFFWYTTTSWMMWNFVASGLLVGATVVLYDGDPSRIWEIIETAKVSCAGVSAAFLVSEMKGGRRPSTKHDLASLRTLGVTGSPLPPSAARWAYEAIASDLLLASFSGGTDVCTGFVGGSPLHPVWAGEISCRCLGANVEIFDEGGAPVIGQEGELVLTEAIPSMPLSFLGDKDDSRYRSAYFDRFPGIWTHGDRATLTERGSVIITGRSDGTLNRGGVRMGTAEFYSTVESLHGVRDSLVVHIEDHSGGPGELLLFLVPLPGADEQALRDDVRDAIRQELSPRHVPDRIDFVPAIPRTSSGKKIEVPVKRILCGVDVNDAVSRSALADPNSLDSFLEVAMRPSGIPTSGTST